MAEAYETSNSRASLTTCSQLGDDPSLGGMASHWPPSSLPLVCVISSQLQPLLVPSGPIFCLSTWPEAGSLQSARVWWWWGPIPRSLSRCILGSALVVLLWHLRLYMHLLLYRWHRRGITESAAKDVSIDRHFFLSFSFHFFMRECSVYLSIERWRSILLDGAFWHAISSHYPPPSLSLHPATHCHAGFFLQVRITFQSLHIISSFHVRQHNLDRIQW